MATVEHPAERVDWQQRRNTLSDRELLNRLDDRLYMLEIVHAELAPIVRAALANPIVRKFLGLR